ncbi:ADP-ribosylglycohydrolase family protein [bacterium]|nr:ADP-ribosylglycohydrolase family protein [bacterium]
MPTPEQYEGCLLGQAVGDAVGMPLEAAAPSRCRELLDQLEENEFRHSGFYYGMPFGQYTDDTQLARELACSLVERQGWDAVDYAGRIADMFESGRIFGQGMATTKAAMRLIQGVTWERSGEMAPSAGNGSAMRAAPVGLVYVENPEQLLKTAHEQGFITHQDPRCSAGSVAIAGGTALALYWEGHDTDAFLQQLSDWVGVYHRNFASSIRKLSHWLELEPKQAASEIRDVGVDTNWHIGGAGITPFVISSVLWSLYSFLRFPNDYWKAVRTAVEVSGDVDTTGAMTGALAGAHLGLDAIPEPLLEVVQDQGEWGQLDLRSLGQGLYTLAEAMHR